MDSLVDEFEYYCVEPLPFQLLMRKKVLELKKETLLHKTVEEFFSNAWFFVFEKICESIKEEKDHFILSVSTLRQEKVILTFSLFFPFVQFFIHFFF